MEDLPAAVLTHAASGSALQRHGPTIQCEYDGLGRQVNEFVRVVHGALAWSVSLSWQPLHLGGHRRWLLCPECQGRRQALYVDGTRLACRKCLKLRYFVQHENERTGLIKRIVKLRRRLGWSLGPLDPIGGRPRYMRHAVFAMRCAEIEVLTDKLVGAVSDWARRAHRALDHRRGPMGAEPANLGILRCAEGAGINEYSEDEDEL
ncbi:hypothetical protein [Pseudorhodoferax sp. Leaf267]|uniref:hypothetical protein n=1 Tax=Pseudorhodoferax sp. Leaf267 TaxID=1736316 RepID=UPI0006F9C018|nr:hypothetical protein [Pseudorhodoferax sp. Leaf267]KQP22122.1 hypothetical protein ASF43_25145 [Pseudorhodoferax sp. Leaf267]